MPQIRSHTVGGSLGTGAVRIEGLSDFTRALKKMDGGFDNRMRDAGQKASRSLLVAARAKAASIGGVANKAAKSLRILRGLNVAGVSGGGKRYPYFYGAEFGAKQYKQFQSWRGNQWAGWGPSGVGYFVHPAIRAEGPHIVKTYWEELDELSKDAFPGAA